MTHSQKIMVIKLLKGYCLAAASSKGKKVYRLMDEKYNPVQIINARIVDRLDRFIKKEIKIWKVDKWGRKTLNLSNVRKLHGRNLLKKMYKERDQLQDTMTISKSRNNKKIIQKNQDNEKVLTLF